jgi:hypothetical protein
MLKVLYFHLPREKQKSIALFIKFLEFKLILKSETRAPLHCASKDNSSSQGILFDGKTESLIQLCNEMMPYLSNAERNKFLSLKEMFESMQLMKELMPLITNMDDLDISTMMEMMSKT